jgi:hypothetical protein
LEGGSQLGVVESMQIMYCVERLPPPPRPPPRLHGAGYWLATAVARRLLGGCTDTYVVEAALTPINIGDSVFNIEADRAAAPVALPSLGAAVRATVAERVGATGRFV